MACDNLLREIQQKVGIEPFKGLVARCANGENLWRLSEMYQLRMWEVRVLNAWLPRAFVFAMGPTLLKMCESPKNDAHNQAADERGSKVA